MQSINPHNGEVVKSYEPHSQEKIEAIVQGAQKAFQSWRQTSFEERANLMRKAGEILRARKAEFAALMTDEMGKVLKDGEAEIEKCAGACDFYAENAKKFLANESIMTDASDSHVAFDPLGVVLAVMPWNFPFWQVFRFAAPALMAGNVGILKHASNVCGTSLAIEDVFRQAGFPQQVFSSVLIPGDAVAKLIRHPHIKAVTLTGSTPAGKSVAEAAGRELKKSVLELGGSDPYLIFEDADIAEAARICAYSRLINAGQSCIAAKRFIAHRKVKDEFRKAFLAEFQKIKWGDPKNGENTMGPQARADLRDGLHKQVLKSVEQGAKLLFGGTVPPGRGAYYPPTILDEVKPGMTAFDEELFGPVAALITADNDDHAIDLANNSPFGLGAALFTKDKEKAERYARRVESGSVFINGFVRSDQRLPFGGVKESGYGRELSSFGIREFVNIKTIYHA